MAASSAARAVDAVKYVLRGHPAVALPRFVDGHLGAGAFLGARLGRLGAPGRALQSREPAPRRWVSAPQMPAQARWGLRGRRARRQSGPRCQRVICSFDGLVARGGHMPEDRQHASRRNVRRVGQEVRRAQRHAQRQRDELACHPISTTHDATNDSWLRTGGRWGRRRRVGSAAAPCHRCRDCSESAANTGACPLELSRRSPAAHVLTVAIATSTNNLGVCAVCMLSKPHPT